MLTVYDTLHLPELQQAVLRAGENGSTRKVQWAHVIDHDDAAHFLEGGELLLTCGQLWPQNYEEEQKMLKSFLRYNISGIVFATGRYLKQCPETVLKFGEIYSIPILEVPFQVPFVKVTRSIHLAIMERQQHKQALADQVSPNLAASLDKANDIKELCKELAKSLSAHIVVSKNAKDMLIAPFAAKNRNRQIKERVWQISERVLPKGWSVLPEFVLEEPHELALPLTLGKVEHTLFVLKAEALNGSDKAAVQYASYRLMELYFYDQEERNKQTHLHLELLELVLEKQNTAKIVIEEKLHKLNIEPKGKWMAGFIVSGDIDYAPAITQLTDVRDICSDWFRQTESVKGFCEFYDDQNVLLIQSELDFKELQKKFMELKSQLDPILHFAVIVIGEEEKHLLNISNSYQNAQILIPIIQFRDDNGGIYYFHDWRREILLYGKMTPEEAYRLRKKLLPDKSLSERGEVLHETLRCLSNNGYNRETVAKILHIHRNTLRYRIEKIEEILGESLTSPQCQFWIQTAFDLESLALQHREKNLQIK